MSRVAFPLAEPLEHLAFACGEHCLRSRRGSLFDDDQEPAALRMARKLQPQDRIPAPQRRKLGGGPQPAQAVNVARDRGGQVVAELAPGKAGQQFARPRAPVFHRAARIEKDEAALQRLLQEHRFGPHKFIDGDIHARNPDAFPAKIIGATWLVMNSRRPANGNS